jgi:AcrR family transcriptional regulator
LREALIELIEERGFEALTIGELTSRAMVSWADFYRIYQDKYDLVEQIFEEALSALLSAVGELGREHPPSIWVKFFEHIADHSPFTTFTTTPQRFTLLLVNGVNVRRFLRSIGGIRRE